MRLRTTGKPIIPFMCPATTCFSISCYTDTRVLAKHVPFALLNGSSVSFARMNQRPLEEPFEMEPDVLYFVRYKPIKKFVEGGKIDLY